MIIFSSFSTYCTIYSVFGFLNDSFSGVEQRPGHSVPVGYLKGASQGPSRNIPFDVTDIPSTASEFILNNVIRILDACMEIGHSGDISLMLSGISKLQ